MTIRECAKSHGFEVVGKLTRHPEWEYDMDESGERKHSGCRVYWDEGGNEYHVTPKGICIVDSDGGVY